MVLFVNHSLKFIMIVQLFPKPVVSSDFRN